MKTLKDVTVLPPKMFLPETKNLLEQLSTLGETLKRATSACVSFSPASLSNWTFFCIALVWVSIQLPFLSAAFKIDEPKILAISDQIRKAPLDPYGFQVDWQGYRQPALAVYANPPLVPAWLTLWRAVFPGSELSCRVAMLPFSILALHAFAILAHHYHINVVWSLALLCCSPSFFLTSQVIMPDIAMLAFFLTSLGYAMKYEEGGKACQFLVSFLAGCLAPIAKYNGLVLFPVLAWCFLLSRRKVTMAMIAVAPLVSLLLLNAFSLVQYNSMISIVIAKFQWSYHHPRIILLFGIVCAVGLGVIPLSGLASPPALYRRRPVFWTILLVIFAAFYWTARGIDYNRTSSFLFALAVSLFCHGMVLAVAGSFTCQGNGGKGALLGIWILAGLAFQVGLMFTSVRYVLFLAPPFILLILKAALPIKNTFFPWLMIMANLVLVLAIAVGDLFIGNAYRQILREQIPPILTATKGRFFYVGEWGLEYYANRLGGKPLRAEDVRSPDFRDGDVILIPTTAWPGILVPPLKRGQISNTTIVDYVPPWSLRTIDCGAAANFYGTAVSHCPRPTFLPWGISSGPSERFSICIIRDER